MDKRIKEQLSLGRLRAIGYYVIAPLIWFLIAHPLLKYCKGNRDTIGYAATYIKESDTLSITLPEIKIGHHRNKSINFEQGHPERSIYFTSNIYYIKKYTKYFEVITIEGVNKYIGPDKKRHDIGMLQHDLSKVEGLIMSVSVNRKQWHDPSYGTKENPVPAFMRHIISGDQIDKKTELALHRPPPSPGTFYMYDYLSPDVVTCIRNVPDSINILYAGYYLRYILPKDEFERLFEKE